MGFLHIVFDDGSNPYIFYANQGSEEEQRESIEKDLEEWRQDYDLELLKAEEGERYHYSAKEKSDRWKQEALRLFEKLNPDNRKRVMDWMRENS